MNTSKKATGMEDMKVRLSTLWVLVMFNMVFADIVGFLNPGALEEMIAMRPAQELLLVFSILLEIPIAMIVLSRLLKYRANRWANIIADVITVLWVIGGGNTSVSYRGCINKTFHLAVVSAQILYLLSRSLKRIAIDQTRRLP